MIELLSITAIVFIVFLIGGLIYWMTEEKK
jgi:hypothetical protein